MLTLHCFNLAFLSTKSHKQTNHIVVKLAMFINKVGLYIFYVLCNSYLSNHIIDRFPRIEKWYWNHKTLKIIVFYPRSTVYKFRDLKGEENGLYIDV